MIVRKNENFVTNIGENKIYNRKIEKVFEVSFDNSLIFKNHAFKLWKTASHKHHPLTRVV